MGGAGRIKSITSSLIKIAVTLFIFYFIVRKVNVTEVLSIPIKNKALLWVALVLAIAVVLVQSLRWHLLCKLLGTGSNFFKNMRAVWAGHLLNNVLPTSSVGDVLRSYSLRGRGALHSQWLSALLFEKYISVITALLIAAAVGLVGQISPDIPDVVEVAAWMFLVVGVAAPIAMHVVKLLGSRILPLSFYSLIETLSLTIFKAVSCKIGIMTSLISFLVNFLICVIFLLVVRSLGLQTNLVDCLFVVPIFTILAGLPISYGGWGIREMTSIHLLQYYGVKPEIALFASLVFGLIIFVSSLPGLVFLPALHRALIGKE